MENNNRIDLFMYNGLKTETPFEYYLRQRAVDREAKTIDRESTINLQAELLKLKYSEQQTENK